jgi:cytochrome c oxidase subunit 2
MESSPTRRYMQSALHPTGLEAHAVADLSWIMFAGATLVLLLVILLTLYALLRHPERRAPIRGELFIFAGGAALPAVTLTALLIYSLGATSDLRAADKSAPYDIEIIGRQWWWEIRYLGEHARRFVTANELHLPRGVRTRIRVTSADVIHSFWAPTLAGKIDLIPGASNNITLEPAATGVYRAQCAEFCGAQHSRMSLFVVVHEPDDFEAWRELERAPAVEPIDELARAGRDVFMNAACAWCHAVRGTPALGRIGPDLTHVGSRLSIASGSFPMTTGNLSAWIVDAQHLKPGNRMPSFRAFSGEELRAVTAYLESLE